MKLYKAQPDNTTRISITRSGEKTVNFSLVETNCGHAIAHIKNVLSELTVNILNNSEKLQITARDYIGKKPMTSRTISCRGVSIKEVESLILKSLEDGM
jgi:hypothetical protein